MPIVDIKQELYKTIESIDDKELLQAALSFLSKGKTQQEPQDLTDDQIRLLKEREQEYRVKMNKKHSL